MPSVSPIRISEHNIAADNLDDHALDVIYQLHQAGFDAYLVGGCVRDALCGVIPKDFDVATNARPEEVRALFRRSRLVGRRFPIAHVRYGRNLIEVSTFRQAKHDHIETNAQGLVVKDRAFGSMADDAFRRDFSANALYFDVSSNEIIDYVGGLEDIAAKRLRFIGDPQERLAEDPVRLLRALRFAAKLDFTIDPQILEHLEDTAERLEEIPRARLFDEFLKLFLSGYAAPVWLSLRDTPLVRSLFPSCNPDSQLVLNAMRNTDERIADNMPVTPGFLLAVLLWDDFQARQREQNPENVPGLTYELAMDTFAVQQQHISLPRRFTMFAREVWQLQTRLEARQPRKILQVVSHKRFRAAFDFLVLRGAEDQQLQACGDWWHTFQSADKQTREQLISALPKGNRKRRGRGGKKGQSSPANDFAADYNSNFNK